MNLNIIGKRKIFFTISIVAMVLVLLVTIFVGPTLDIEFKVTRVSFVYSVNENRVYRSEERRVERV